eukprot:8998583-Heterocapsa_arctica.AAC.1
MLQGGIARRHRFAGARPGGSVEKNFTATRLDVLQQDSAYQASQLQEDADVDENGSQGQAPGIGEGVPGDVRQRTGQHMGRAIRQSEQGQEGA